VRDNLDVMENMSDDTFMDVSILPEITQIISSTAENGTKRILEIGCSSNFSFCTIACYYANMYNGISSESQESPNNLDVMENILNDASNLPDVAQMISNTMENDTKGILQLGEAICSKFSL
jgi:hypothetical protein